MRLLITTHPASGHFNPMVAIARALKNAGHDVLVATSEAFCREVAGAGLEPIPAGIDWLESDASATFEQLRGLGPSELNLRPVFLDLAPRAMLPDLLRIIRRERPDLIVREYYEHAGGLAAQAARLPHAVVGINGFCPPPVFGRLFGREYAALREAAGLGPDATLASLYGEAYIDLFPPSLHVFPVRTTCPALSVRPEPYDRSGEHASPAWLSEIGGRPMVYVTMGTVFNRVPEIFDATIAALAGEPIDLIVTLGEDQDPSMLRAAPHNVRVERYVPQSLLLPRCAAVITNGGFNTFVGALLHGVPMLVLPVAADHASNAAVLEDRGAALSLTTPDAGEIRKAVRRLLDEPSFAVAARGLRAELDELPGPDAAVRLLESIA